MSRAQNQVAYHPLFSYLPTAPGAIVAEGEGVSVSFCGLGGACLGITRAMGRPPTDAINHWDKAIEIHALNAPHTRHHQEDVRAVDPVTLAEGRRQALAWFSPDCTHFSGAKGGKPLDNNIRGLAWVALDYARMPEHLRPRVIMLENVTQFRGWGPLGADDRPIVTRKGETYRAFRAALEAEGYTVEDRDLVAADFGTPTTRKRFFMVARCDGQPIRWPEPTHAPVNDPRVLSGELQPWRPASECVDWTLPMHSIFGRKPKGDRRKPLKPASLRRIALGVYRHVLCAGQPFIVNLNHSGAHFRGQRLDEPFRTVTAAREAIGPVDVTLAAVALRNNGGGLPPKSAAYSLEEPMKTVLASGGKQSLIAAHLSVYYGSKHECGQPLTEPARTVRTVSSMAVVGNTLEPTGGDLGRAHEVAALLRREVGEALDAHLEDGLVVLCLDGQTYVLTDITLRMFEPQELKLAQGLPPEFVIDRDRSGRKLSEKDQMRLVGNMVCPQPAEALVRANFSESHFAQAAD